MLLKIGFKQEPAIESYLELVLTDILAVQPSPGAMAMALVAHLPLQSSPSMLLLRKQALFWTQTAAPWTQSDAETDDSEVLHPRVLKGLKTLQRAVVRRSTEI